MKVYIISDAKFVLDSYKEEQEEPSTSRVKPSKGKKQKKENQDDIPTIAYVGEF